MSSFSRISKGLFRERFRIITFILALHIIALVASRIWNMFDSSSEPNSLTGGTFIAVTVGIVLLAIMNEGVYVRDRYRLIPVADKTLYLSNFWTSFVSVIYLLVGEGVIYFAAYKMFPNPYDQIMINDFNSEQQYLFKFEVVIGIVLTIMMVLSAVTLLHLLIESISSFLPFKNQKVIKTILAFVVTLVIGYPFKYITGSILKIMGIDNLDNSFKAVTHVVSAGMGMMVIWIIVFSLINLYLLNRWSETTK